MALVHGSNIVSLGCVVERGLLLGCGLTMTRLSTLELPRTAGDIAIKLQSCFFVWLASFHILMIITQTHQSRTCTPAFITHFYEIYLGVNHQQLLSLWNVFTFTFLHFSV